MVIFNAAFLLSSVSNKSNEERCVVEKLVILNYTADTHEGTVPSFTGSSPCSFDQFNLMGELPKMDYQNCLHFGTHHFVLWISTSSGDKMGWEGERSRFKANGLGGKLTRCRKLTLWIEFILALDPSP